jgi:hypothetical protein
LVETKDIANKLTLFDHLLIIFDRVTASKFDGFGLTDFMQVEKARRLELTHVLDSVNKLNNQVNAVKGYHSKLKKLAVNDRIGAILDQRMPEFLKNTENLVHVSQL